MSLYNSILSNPNVTRAQTLLNQVTRMVAHKINVLQGVHFRHVCITRHLSYSKSLMHCKMRTLQSIAWTVTFILSKVGLNTIGFGPSGIIGGERVPQV